MAEEEMPRGARLAGRLPAALGSIRVRLAVLYSVLLFGLASILIGSVYLGMTRALDSQPITERVEYEQRGDIRYATLQPRNGPPLLIRIQEESTVVERDVVNPLKQVERDVNLRALERFRTYSFAALGGLFLVSLVMGWVLADRALRPIGRITRVAKRIQGSDLSQRIALDGPNDELRQLADTFDDMLARLDDAFETQRTFIHEASHELRNPIAVIRTNVDVALDDPSASIEDLRETIEVVGRSAERMGVLVDDLLTYARRESPAERTDVIDVGALVDEVSSEFAAPADARNLQLVHVAPPGLRVCGDAEALKRALANLLANAVRLAPESSQVRVATGAENDEVWIAVEDRGPGIALDDQARVFDRFFRGDEKAGRSDGRSGLGLTIVKQIASAHGGRVGLVSEPGVGSTFSIWLPEYREPERMGRDDGVSSAVTGSAV